MASRLGYSPLGKIFSAIGARGPSSGLNTARAVLVPPTSPASSILSDLLGDSHRWRSHRPRQDKTFDGLGEAFILVRIGDVGGLALHLLAGIAHRDAQPAFLEHQHIVGLISERSDLLQRDFEVVRKPLDNDTLVGRRVRHIEVVW